VRPFNSRGRFPGDKRTELAFCETDTKEWRYGPSATLIRDDGCYAFRIEGDGLVDSVTFIEGSRFTQAGSFLVSWADGFYAEVASGAGSSPRAAPSDLLSRGVARGQSGRKT
jgi:hypothetical protein